MPKPKQFLKEGKKKPSKHAPATPETADEYLAAGVDFEEAGEKWRAGDAAKSARFFVRAINIYDEGLSKFPRSFDLAYNKARVQFDLTQQPRLIAELPGDLLDLLRVALESSRVALSLGQDNPDVLFNTAQLLTSMVDYLNESGKDNTPKEDIFRMLEEALELFQRCLTLQEFQFAESQAQRDAMMAEDDGADAEEGGAPLSNEPESSTTAQTDTFEKGETVEDDRWATIVEPVTNDSLLDTVLAQLEALSTLCGLTVGDEGRGLAWIEEYASGLINNKLPAYVKDTDRKEETALTRANFLVALADANFRAQKMDGPTYEKVIIEAFAPLDLSDDPEGLCDKADAWMDYSNALALLTGQESSTNSSRWKALTTALEALTAASKLPSADNLARIHLARGDAELARFQLGRPPSSYGPAAKNGPTLLKNAGTYYRGAEGHAKASNILKSAKEAVVKAALATSLAGDHGRLLELRKLEPEALQAVLTDAVDERLISLEWLIQEGIVQ